jgi:predicted amidohydrolase YtcJ
MSIRMKTHFLWHQPIHSLLLLLVASSSGGAYTLVGNGAIYTVDESAPWVDNVAIDKDGVIVAVGTKEEIYNTMGKEEDLFWDLGGRMMLPGFQDAHLHAVEAGINKDICYVDAFAHLYDIPFYFDDCVDGGRFGGEGWIMGAGIDIAVLEEAVIELCYDYPITVLDDSFPNTPVVILDSLGHGAVVNSKAMELVGYDQLTGNPPGGIIDRDPSTGKPTGIVRENAQQPFRDAAFPPTPQNQDVAYQSLLGALGTLAANGITTVSDAGGFWRQAQTEAWARAEAEGKLTARASNTLYVYPDTPIDEQLSDLTSRFSNDPSKLVRFNQAKIYVDGILSLSTSALKEPYTSSSFGPDSDFELGFEYFQTQQNLNDVATTLSNAGFQLHLHVTGDRGAALALDAIAVANSESGPHRLTHCYLVAPEDRGRFKELNAVADFQLSPSSLSRSYEDFVSDMIGADRSSMLLPALEVHEAGGLVALSSDWDADSLSPLEKLKTVLTRSDGKALPDLETAIRMMTLNPAILLQQEPKTGSISVGKFADLVILDQNIFDLEVSKIDESSVVATIFQGEPIYDPAGVLGQNIGTEPPAAAFWGKPRTMTSSLLPVLLTVVVVLTM